MQNATKVIKKLMKYSCKQQILYFKFCVWMFVAHDIEQILKSKILILWAGRGESLKTCRC